MICNILGFFVCILGGMADSFIAGLYLDSEAVSAVSLISPITNVQYFVALLTSVGAAMMYSRALGAFDVERSRKYAGMGLMISLTLGIVMTAAMIAGKKAILNYYGCTGNVYDLAALYYDPIIPLAFLQPLIWGVYQLINYDGDASLLLIDDITMAVSNAVFSLIWVKSMGISGLAYGTLASYILGMLILIPHFFKKTNSIHFKPYFRFRDMLEMIKLSSASSLTTLYTALIDILFNKFVIDLFGEAYLPAYAVVNVGISFGSFLMCPISSGACFISVNYGENNPFAIRRTMKLVHKNMIYNTIVYTVLMFIMASYWPGIYGITDPEIVAVSVFAGRVIALASVFEAFMLTYVAYYPTVGKSFAGNLLGMLYSFAGPLAVAYPLARFVNFNAMSIGFALTPLFALLITVLYLVITKQMKGFPYLLPSADEKEAHYDVLLTEKNIVELRDKVGEFLAGQGITDKKINAVELIVEDTLVYILRKNKKKVLCECDVLVNDDHIRVITKDNGIVFDITKEADSALDLRCYVVARMMEESTKESTNTTTISFNRNTYVWDRA